MQALLTLYAIERWLARLAASRYADSFVLKGGMLLAVFDARRPTMDADLLARHLANDEATVVARVREIAELSVPDDGVEFIPDTISARAIRDDGTYPGVRVSMICRVSAAKVKLTLDVNFGDPITPAPQRISLPSQRADAEPVALWGYPIETVIAEKACTAVALGEASTRVRDYADLYTLTGRHVISGTGMRAALEATSTYRQIELAPLADAIGSLVALRDPAYRAFRARLGPDGTHLPPDLGTAVAAVVDFVDPLIVGDDVPHSWHPGERVWRPGPGRATAVPGLDVP